MIEDNRTKVHVSITKRGNTYRLLEEKEETKSPKE